MENCNGAKGGIKSICMVDENGNFVEINPNGKTKFKRNEDGSFPCTLTLDLKTGKITGYNLITEDEK